MLPMMKRTLTITLDFDWLYRKFIQLFAREFNLRAEYFNSAFQQNLNQRLENVINRLHRHHGPSGILARTWPSGSMLLCVAVLLSVVLLASFLY